MTRLRTLLILVPALASASIVTGCSRIDKTLEFFAPYREDQFVNGPRRQPPLNQEMIALTTPPPPPPVDAMQPVPFAEPQPPQPAFAPPQTLPSITRGNEYPTGNFSATGVTPAPKESMAPMPMAAESEPAAPQPNLFDKIGNWFSSLNAKEQMKIEADPQAEAYLMRKPLAGNPQLDLEPQIVPPEQALEYRSLQPVTPLTESTLPETPSVKPLVTQPVTTSPAPAKAEPLAVVDDSKPVITRLDNDLVPLEELKMQEDKKAEEQAVKGKKEQDAKTEAEERKKKEEADKAAAEKKKKEAEEKAAAEKKKKEADKKKAEEKKQAEEKAAAEKKKKSSKKKDKSSEKEAKPAAVETKAKTKTKADGEFPDLKAVPQTPEKAKEAQAEANKIQKELENAKESAKKAKKKLDETPFESLAPVSDPLPPLPDAPPLSAPDSAIVPPPPPPPAMISPPAESDMLNDSQLKSIPLPVTLTPDADEEERIDLPSLPNPDEEEGETSDRDELPAIPPPPPPPPLPGGASLMPDELSPAAKDGYITEMAASSQEGESWVMLSGWLPFGQSDNKTAASQ